MRSTRGGTTDVEKAVHIEKKLKGILTNNWVVFIELLIDHRADFVASVRNHHLHLLAYRVLPPYELELTAALHALSF